MPTILITGGAGFIGGALAERLVADPDNLVVAVDDLSTGRPENLPAPAPNFRFVKGSVNDYGDISAVMLGTGFDYVFHYSACVGVGRTLRNPARVLADVDGIRNVLNLSKNTGVRRVFYSSSSEIYGEPVEFPQNEETTPLNSKLPYAVVKNLGEAWLKVYRTEYGLDYTIFRFFNTYGPGQSADFVVAKFLAAALAGEPITVYGDGAQTRTFCHIADNVEATVAALNGDLHVNDVVNIGSDVEVTVLELARAIVRATGSGSPIVHLPPLAEGDMARRRPDIAKMRALLGREPISLAEGLERLVAPQFKHAAAS